MARVRPSAPRMMNPVTTYEMQSGKAAAKAAGARAELEARTGAAASVCRQQTEMARLRHDNRVSAAKEHAAMAQADIEMRMSVLITATQRENREQAEADVRAAFETEAELAAKEREVSTAEADATRAAKDAEAQEHHDQLVARIEADLAPYRLAAERYGAEVATEAERRRTDAVATSERARNARVEKLRSEAARTIAELTEQGAVEIAAAERRAAEMVDAGRKVAADAEHWMNAKLAGRVVKAERQIAAREAKLAQDLSQSDAKLSARAEAAVDSAAARSDHDSPHITVMAGDIGDGGRTPWTNDHFDGVLVLDSFVALWPSLPHALAELRRVVKPAGNVICAVELGRLREAAKAGIISPGSPLDLQDICQAFKEAGFLPQLVPGLTPAALVAREDNAAAARRAHAIKMLRDKQIGRCAGCSPTITRSDLLIELPFEM
jgi:SAM-dependent methyltransferase